MKDFYFACIGNGNIETVRSCINSGIDINVVDDKGWTGLMSSCYGDKYELVKMFISCGADIDLAMDRMPWTMPNVIILTFITI